MNDLGRQWLALECLEDVRWKSTKIEVIFNTSPREMIGVVLSFFFLFLFLKKKKILKW